MQLAFAHGLEKGVPLESMRVPLFCSSCDRKNLRWGALLYQSQSSWGKDVPSVDNLTLDNLSVEEKEPNLLPHMAVDASHPS